MPIRDDFPQAGDTDEIGGTSDGFVYTTEFRAATLQQAYDLLLEFLEAEGYDDIPLPLSATELKHWRLPARRRQLRFWEENGYIHNPIKILFSNTRQRNTLTLKIYDECADDFLMRFHGVGPFADQG